MELVIDSRGTVRCLYTEALDLSTLGRVTIRRASHVEPTDDGHWTADLSPSGGPLLGPFDTRTQALAAETGWIEAWLVMKPGGGKRPKRFHTPFFVSRA